MKAMLIFAFIAGLASARLLPHSVGNLELKPAEAPKYCESPIAKKKVELPEMLQGRSAYYQTHTMYSGYVNVTSEDYLFYWFFESKQSAGQKAPLMLWSNGGPGCSAMEGATTENGPMVLDMIKQSYAISVGELSDNPYSWVDQANVLYVDQPRYVGFSFGTANPPNYVLSSVDAGKDIVTFLLGWMGLFPDFAGREVILSSESYGGHYVPAWAQAVNDHNDKAPAASKINLKGLIIGNGIVNETVQSDELYYKFLRSHDLIPAGKILTLLKHTRQTPLDPLGNFDRSLRTYVLKMPSHLVGARPTGSRRSTSATNQTTMTTASRVITTQTG
jgi:carboxypeptidase C (cathepsin A)